MKSSPRMEHFVIFRHKKVPYYIREIIEGKYHFQCDAARLDKTMDYQELGKAIARLPLLIERAQKEMKDKTRPHVLRFLVSAEDKDLIEKESFDRGFGSVSDYLRALSLGETDPEGVRPYGKNRRGAF